MDHDQQFIKIIRKELEERKETIEKELLSIIASSSDKRSIFPLLGDSEDENAQEVAAYSDRLSLSETLEKSLRDIINTLKRIEEGEYGMCKYCHKSISKARLKARPVSSSCIECKKNLVGED